MTATSKFGIVCKGDSNPHAKSRSVNCMLNQGKGIPKYAVPNSPTFFSCYEGLVFVLFFQVSSANSNKIGMWTKYGGCSAESQIAPPKNLAGLFGTNFHYLKLKMKYSSWKFTWGFLSRLRTVAQVFVILCLRFLGWCKIAPNCPKACPE